MKTIKKRVEDELAAGNIRSNRECPYHPSHFKGQNCTFCYCPFYPCEDERNGHYIRGTKIGDIWSCEDCLFIHRDRTVEYALPRILERGIAPGDHEGMMEVFRESMDACWKRGKAVMVVGATSDAGKSMTVAALGRILLRRGYLCAPFKSQNMSLNSRVTAKGEEIAMVQMLQAQAMGLTIPNYHMNPILLKPKGNTVSQVVVEGKPFGDYDVPSYYNDFVPGPGREIVRRNIDFLKDHYDFILMEGAGSPAEINIYDKDIANMRAAEIADADCILVVNVEWGGSFAYAIGTVELMPPEDRKSIKGIILNNVRGDPSRMKDGADELSKRCGIPVIGIIPHAEVELPQEDSEAFRGVKERGNGALRIAVIKLPRIANFTDLDPLYTEDTTVVFADCPSDVLTADAVIIPGTKNTIDDYEWLIATGIAAGLCMSGSLAGPLLFLLIYNIPTIALRWLGVKYGYSLGANIIGKISDADVMHKLTTALSIVGLMVIGAMVATNVSLTTPIAFDINGTMFSLQETFDSIFPRLLPVCALGALYALNKKGVPVLTQIIGIMVIGVVAGLLGIFG